jgi:acyl dehydratase
MFDKSKNGQSFPPFTFEVERGKIRELALAIGDDNPIYQSREEAQAAGYPDVLLYPTSPTTFAFWGNRKMISQLVSLGINVMRILHGEEEYEYLAPIYPGDILTGVMTLVDGKTRQGQGGSSMDILTIEIAYTNQHGTPVLKAREVIIVRE